jgi:hypothetical protein
MFLQQHLKFKTKVSNTYDLQSVHTRHIDKVRKEKKGMIKTNLKEEQETSVA